MREDCTFWRKIKQYYLFEKLDLGTKTAILKSKSHVKRSKTAKIVFYA